MVPAAVDGPITSAREPRGGTGLICHSTQVAPVARQQILALNPGFAESVFRLAKVGRAPCTSTAARSWPKVCVRCSHLRICGRRAVPMQPTFSLARPPGHTFAYPASGRSSARHWPDGGCTPLRTKPQRSPGMTASRFTPRIAPIFSTFIIPRTSTSCEDDYGRSLENSARLLVREALHTIRDAKRALNPAGQSHHGRELLPAAPRGRDADIPSYTWSRSTARLVDHRQSLSSAQAEPPYHGRISSRSCTTASSDRENVSKRSQNAWPASGPPGTYPASIAEAERLIASGAVDGRGRGPLWLSLTLPGDSRP